MIRTLRWILVVPMGVAGWFIAFASAVTLHSLIWDFCPPEFQVSGMCTHPWAFIAEDALVWAGAFVSAVLVVAFATRTAPSYKSQIATACLVIGVAVAFWAYLETYALGAFIGASAGGFLAVVLVVRKHGWRKKSSYGKHRQYELFI